MTDPQQQALPPLPERLCIDDDRAWFSDSQMCAYAAEAVARALAASAPSREVPENRKGDAVICSFCGTSSSEMQQNVIATKGGAICEQCHEIAGRVFRDAAPSPSAAAEESKP